MSIQPFSSPMRFFRYLGLTAIAWSLRRLYCPVGPTDLVLEVGSGGNPYYRANVLLDAYENTRERHWVKLISDRPTVLGFVENLPFKDNAFDFVIASHVLEHSSDPAKFLNELQRVAKAGYIETPDAFMERINPYRDHRLEVTTSDGKLVIRKKIKWKPDPEVVELYEAKVKKILTQETMRKHPFEFHVRYFWQNTIKFQVLNSEAKADWEPPVEIGDRCVSRSFLGLWKAMVLKWARAFFSQKQRNDNIDLMDLLICPACRSQDLILKDKTITCSSCSKTYPVRDHIPVMQF